MSKNLVLMRDVICRYHPEFRRSRDLQAYGIKHADIFNVERLIEQSLAAVGGYDVVDEAGRDFNCPWNSDSKTATLHPDRSKACGRARLNNVENKIGSIRATIYNPFQDRLDFMYVPHDRLLAHKERKSYDQQWLTLRWHPMLDHYHGFTDCLVADFEELALAGG